MKTTIQVGSSPVITIIRENEHAARIEYDSPNSERVRFYAGERTHIHGATAEELGARKHVNRLLNLVPFDERQTLLDVLRATVRSLTPSGVHAECPKYEALTQRQYRVEIRRTAVNYDVVTASSKEEAEAAGLKLFAEGGTIWLHNEEPSATATAVDDL